MSSLKSKHTFRESDVCGQWCLECRLYDRVLPAAFLFGVLLFLIYFVTVAPPLDFPSGALVKVEKGETLRKVGEVFKERHIIRSILLFTAAAEALGGESHVIAGRYFFPGPQNLLRVAARVVVGDFELTPARVTIPEGATAREIGEILEQKLVLFDTGSFLATATPAEGYLFPDTYFFLPGEEPDVVVATLNNNFSLQVKTLAPEIEVFGKPLSEVVVMASLLEREAPKMQDRRIIAGILWKRIDRGMLLQVDAVFPYIIGKNSFQLTREDLRLDHPYNTYVNKGLPPGAIANPGLDAMLAAVTPIKTNYLYYLSDRQGNFHYSATYAQHLRAKAKYLGS